MGASGQDGEDRHEGELQEIATPGSVSQQLLHQWGYRRSA